MSEETPFDLAGDESSQGAYSEYSRLKSRTRSQNCAICGDHIFNADSDESVYHEVSSWVNGPKLDSPKLRRQTGFVAHKECVDNLVAGQAPDQPEMEL